MIIQFMWLNLPKIFVSENILSHEQIFDPDKFLTGWLILILVFICNFGHNFDTMLKLASLRFIRKNWAVLSSSAFQNNHVVLKS